MKNKVSRFLLNLGFIVVLALSACQSQPSGVTPRAAPTPMASDISPTEVLPPIAGGWDLGRTFTKLKNEKKITLGFLGGSITDGGTLSKPETNSYRALVTGWFKRRFPDAAITAINAGANGTGSDFGAFRAYYDVGKADLVFIEFAVNDEPAKSSDRDRLIKYTEGIVRRLYLANPNVEIVFVDLASQNTAAAYKNEKLPFVVEWHRELANHYTLAGVNSILYINPGQDMVNYIDSGQATWTAGSNPMTGDGVHPNDAGHRFIAEKIISALKQAWLSSTPLAPFKSLPVSLVPEPVQNGQVLDTDQSQRSSGWDYQTTPDPFIRTFATSALAAKSTGATLDFTFKDSKYIGIYLLKTLNEGSFEAWIDAGPKQSFSTKGVFFERRRDFLMISDHVSGGTHTLHVRVTALPITFIAFMINP